MKQLMTLIVMCAFVTFAFAQKNEVKAIEKAVKSSNFADAKSAVEAAEALIGNMDDKTKAKFYFLKAKALYANGTATEADTNGAIATLETLKDFESSIGKLKYTEEANTMKSDMLNAFLNNANKALDTKNYNSAAQEFSRAYKLSLSDTTFLYYAASSAVTAKDYDKALEDYLKLKELNYTGIKMNYLATNAETGQEESFNDKSTRDFSVKVKTHTNPVDKMSESKKAEIVKNIALIYISKGEDEKALAAMSDARAENPDDLGLLLSEGNIHLKMGNRDKFRALMEEATEKDPNNAELQYNLGVLAAEAENVEQARTYYEKAIALNPNYADAYNNLAVLILGGEAAIVEEMNGLGTSAADNRRYDELKEKRGQLYRDAIPHLEKALELKGDNIDTAKTLMNIFSVLGEMDKFKTMKAKVEDMESGGN